MTINGLMRTHTNGELRAKHKDQHVTLCGWVNNYRDLGGLHFIDLRDKYGMTQLGFEKFEQDLSILKKCYIESVIKVSGVVSLRPKDAFNSDMKTGEVEVQVTKLEILSQVDPAKIPFLPHGKIEAKEDTRLKYRYLDLRTDKLQSILKLRSDTYKKTRETLTSQDFIEVETPILYKSTPEGARDYIVPSRVHPGSVYALPQSPQTLKQLLMIGNTDKYFQIVKCFRDEDLRADRQPEFTQIDIEASFATQEYMKNLATSLVRNIFDDQSIEFKDMHYNDAMSLYGSDKPDARFELKQITCTDLFKESEFSLFNTIAKHNGLIKALFVPAALGSFSRKDTDGFTKVVEPFGGKGVAFYKVSNDERTAGVSKFITDEVHASLCKKLTEIGENPGSGTWLFFASNEKSVAHACANALRLHLGDRFNLRNPNDRKFLWVHSFPLLEWDDGFGRFIACHHPFTMPKVERLSEFMEANFEDQAKFSDFPAEAYDLVCNGYEIGGGSVRIANSEVQNKMFHMLGMETDEINKLFGFFVEALKYGVPPHAGIAFGLDRIVMLLAKTENIRDVIAFPKTTSASCMMSAAPSKPSDGQTDELHFKWLEKVNQLAETTKE